MTSHAHLFAGPGPSSSGGRGRASGVGLRPPPLEERGRLWRMEFLALPDWGSRALRAGDDTLDNRTMTEDPVTQLLHDPRFRGAPVTWETTSEEYRKVRHAWLTHVSAEERLFVPYGDDEFRTQMTEMLSVFADDCVMELVPTGESWKGRDRTEAFYRAFLSSFSGMEWVPQALVIGPQGVLDVVDMTGTLLRPFAGLSGVNRRLHLQWVIHFPWVAELGKFRGETVYSIQPVPVLE